MPFRRFQVLLLALSLAAAGAVVLATRHGVGLSPDSATYIAGARQLARGHGLTTPQGGEAITHFPPLFPLVMAAPSIVGIDAIPTARVLNLLLFAATINLAGIIAYRSAGNSVFAGLMAAALVATSVDLLNVHAWAWSEPLFICCGFAGLWVLQKHLWNPRIGLLVGAAVLAAAAFLARYAGATVVLTGVLGLLLATGRPLRRRFGEASLFLAITLAPLAGWVVRNKLVSENATNREVVFHPVTPKQLSQACTTVGGWLVPNNPARRGVHTMAERFGVPVVAGLLVLIVTTAAVARRRSMAVADPVIAVVPWLFGLFLPVYTGFLLVSVSWFDAQIVFDDRMLSPLLAATICFGVSSAAAALPPKRSSGSLVRACVAAMGLLVVGWFLYRDTVWVRAARETGLGYSSRTWRRSAVMDAIRRLPPDVFIYTNSPGAVLLLADRVCADVPEKTNRNSTLAKKDFEGRMTYMRQRLEGGAYLAYFRTVKSRHNLPTEEDLNAAMPLIKQLDAREDGVIYRMVEPATQP